MTTKNLVKWIKTSWWCITGECLLRIFEKLKLKHLIKKVKVTFPEYLPHIKAQGLKEKKQTPDLAWKSAFWKKKKSLLIKAIATTKANIILTRATLTYAGTRSITQ